MDWSQAIIKIKLTDGPTNTPLKLLTYFLLLACHILTLSVTTAPQISTQPRKDNVHTKHIATSSHTKFHYPNLIQFQTDRQTDGRRDIQQTYRLV